MDAETGAVLRDAQAAKSGQRLRTRLKAGEPIAAWKSDRQLPGSNGLEESFWLGRLGPDSKEHLRKYPWDLMLCGHTHGGQCDLVFGTPFAPVRNKRYVRGLHPWNDRWIHTTKGVGNLHGLRFNCRPEVSLLTFT